MIFFDVLSECYCCALSSKAHILVFVLHLLSRVYFSYFHFVGCVFWSDNCNGRLFKNSVQPTQRKENKICIQNVFGKLCGKEPHWI
jgi:hypothetical protein